MMCLWRRCLRMCCSRKVQRVPLGSRASRTWRKVGEKVAEGGRLAAAHKGHKRVHEPRRATRAHACLLIKEYIFCVVYRDWGCRMLGKTQRVTAPTGLPKAMESAVAQRGRTEQLDPRGGNRVSAPAASVCGVAGGTCTHGGPTRGGCSERQSGDVGTSTRTHHVQITSH